MGTFLLFLATVGQDVDFRPLHERGECGCENSNEISKQDWKDAELELKMGSPEIVFPDHMLNERSEQNLLVPEYPEGFYYDGVNEPYELKEMGVELDTTLYPEKVTYADTKDAYQDAVQEISENGGTRAVAFCRNGQDYREVLKFIEQLKEDGYNGEYPIPLVIPTKRESTEAFRNYWGFNEKTRWPYIALIRRDSRTMKVQGVRSVDLDLPATTTQYAEYLGSYSTFREASSSGSAWGAQKESFQKQQYQRQQYRLQPLLRGRGLFGGRACAT